MGNIKITEVGHSDVSSIVDLLNEIDEFYGDKTTEGRSERVSNVTSALFDDGHYAYALLASTESGRPVGFASYSFVWPAAGSSRSLYLKELYVSRGYRRSGTGRQLMQKLYDVAKDKDCSRVEWTTDVANGEAQSFYERMGESVFQGKVFYRHEIVS